MGNVRTVFFVGLFCFHQTFCQSNTVLFLRMQTIVSDTGGRADQEDTRELSVIFLILITWLSSVQVKTIIDNTSKKERTSNPSK